MEFMRRTKPSGLTARGGENQECEVRQINKKITNPNEIQIYDLITIIYNDYDGKPTIEEIISNDMTLGDIDIHKAKGIIVIAESPLHGEVYRYGNQGDFWERIGEVCGYA